MDLKVEILREYSKANVEAIANYIGADKKLFADLVSVFLAGNYRITQRSSWILSECVSKYPFLIQPYYQIFLDKVQDPATDDTTKRNIIRAWQYVEIPADFQGEIYDICFKLLSSNAAIAIIAFSMTVCYHISKQIPELKPELILMFEELLQKHQFDGSPAIKSRAKKILVQLNKKK